MGAGGYMGTLYLSLNVVNLKPLLKKQSLVAGSLHCIVDINTAL